MRCKQILLGLFASLGMFVLILDGQTALDGGRLGAELCMKTVIPSLFPFFILSNIITNVFSGVKIPLLRPLGQLCRMPAGTEYILLSGFLGGYPVGAQCIHTAYQSGQLKKEDAERMLGFCCNAGPAFLFGMVASFFPNLSFCWALWGIHIIGAILSALLLPGKITNWNPHEECPSISMVEMQRRSLRTIAIVCGWVILFRVLIAFLQKWFLWIFPNELQTLLIGFLELSNGCLELSMLSNIKYRFLICSAILAFGGLCVTMQTISVTNGLSLRSYYIGKTMQTLFSITICAGILFKAWYYFLGVLVASSFLFRKFKKRVAIAA